MKAQPQENHTRRTGVQLIKSAYDNLCRKPSSARRLALLCTIAILSLGAPAARAQAYIYDHFDYPTGPITGQNGGSSGWAGAWAGGLDNVVTSGSTTSCNGQTPTGNALGPNQSSPGPHRALKMPVSGTAGSSLLLGAVMTSDVGGGSAGATLSNTTTGSSRFAIGAVGGYWALVNGTAPYLSSIAVTPGVPTCLVAQIDFSVSGGLDRMRMWINPPLQRLQATPDIDITSAHVSRFSGVDWETQQGQTLDEISVNTAGGMWTAVNDLLGDRNLDTPLLLTDGGALIHQLDTGFWRRLTPDIYGSYTSGITAFSYIATMPTGYAPYGFASAVLPDGRVLVEGGEYNNGGAAETTLGAIYQPTTDTWQNVPPPTGWNTIGDAPSVVLPDGTFMLGNCCTHDPSLYDALFDATNLTWTPTGALQAEYNSEHGWTLLPGMMDSPAGSVLMVNAFFPITDGRISERYFPPPLGFWIPAGSTIVNLWDCLAGVSCEIGPAVLRPDGTVFATGATFSHPGHTAVYHTSLSDPYYASWTEGPDFPQDSSGGNLGVADGPAALLPNGNVLVDAGLGYYGAASFLEITLNNQWIFVPAPPTGGGILHRADGRPAQRPSAFHQSGPLHLRLYAVQSDFRSGLGAADQRGLWAAGLPSRARTAGEFHQRLAF